MPRSQSQGLLVLVLALSSVHLDPEAPKLKMPPLEVNPYKSPP